MYKEREEIYDPQTPLSGKCRSQWLNFVLMLSRKSHGHKQHAIIASGQSNGLGHTNYLCTYEFTTVFFSWHAGFSHDFCIHVYSMINMHGNPVVWQTWFLHDSYLHQTHFGMLLLISFLSCRHLQIFHCSTAKKKHN